MDRYHNNPHLETEDSMMPEFRSFPDTIQVHAKRLLDDLERKLAKESRPKHPDTSIYTGSTGIAYLYWHLSTLGLEDRDRYLQKAVRIVGSGVAGLDEKRMSFIAGDAGLLALSIVIHHQAGKGEQRNQLLVRLIKLSSKVLDQTDPGTPNEILYGRAGYLFALLFINAHTPTLAEASLIRKVTNVIILEGQKAQLDYLYYEWHEKCYVGAAHGIFGILYVLLKARVYLSPEQLTLIRKTMDWLLTHRFPSGNFPSSLGSKEDRLIHWCHGGPGAIFTLLEANKVFGEKTYLSAAYGCADVIWRRGLLKKGYGLCHGVSGNAYALMAFYLYTKEPRYLKRAYAFAQWCFDHGKMADQPPDRPLSLFEGQAGAVCMLYDFGWNTAPKFPCYQL